MNTFLEEKEISYQSANTYSVLNKNTETTRHIWFVCHGMGYLSRYFLKYFRDLNPDENYVVAPQAPSKYYQQPKMHVGANWLTRDNTKQGIENIMHYFDAIFNAEALHSCPKLIVFGYSQGVSVATRYLAKRQVHCKQLVLHSGGIPLELQPEDFDYLPHDCAVKLVYGTKDEFWNAQRIEEESDRARKLFGERLEILPFDGPHVVNTEIVNNLV
jgi:predicted esterase